MAFFVGQNERVDELNERILHRLFDNKPIQPKFTPMPESTKYVKFPVLYKTPIRLTSTETTVDTESDLYCRNDRLAKYDTGAKYTPVLLGGTAGLKSEAPMNVAGFSSTIGNDLFHNHTRTQLRQGVENLR